MKTIEENTQLAILIVEKIKQGKNSKLPYGIFNNVKINYISENKVDIVMPLIVSKVMFSRTEKGFFIDNPRDKQRYYGVSNKAKFSSSVVEPFFKQCIRDAIHEWMATKQYKGGIEHEYD